MRDVQDHPRSYHRVGRGTCARFVKSYFMAYGPAGARKSPRAQAMVEVFFVNEATRNEWFNFVPTSLSFNHTVGQIIARARTNLRS